MTKVIMMNWREGLNKVALTKLQMEFIGISLSESKTNVDTLLDSNKVTLIINDDSIVEKFIIQADKIGVECIISKD